DGDNVAAVQRSGEQPIRLPHLFVDVAVAFARIGQRKLPIGGDAIRRRYGRGGLLGLRLSGRRSRGRRRSRRGGLRRGGRWSGSSARGGLGGGGAEDDLDERQFQRQRRLGVGAEVGGAEGLERARDRLDVGGRGQIAEGGLLGGAGLAAVIDAGVDQQDGAQAGDDLAR